MKLPHPLPPQIIDETLIDGALFGRGWKFPTSETVSGSHIHKLELSRAYTSCTSAISDLHLVLR